MQNRRRETWDITPADLPPAWIVEREPRLAGMEENAIFRLILHRSRLGWGRRGRDSRAAVVFHQIPRGVLDDLLMTPLPKGEFARAMWASTVPERMCLAQRSGSWVAGILGLVMFIACEVLRHRRDAGVFGLGGPGGGEVISAIELLAGALITGALFMALSLRHLPYATLGKLHNALEGRRFKTLMAHNPVEGYAMFFGALVRRIPMLIRGGITLLLLWIAGVGLMLTLPSPSPELTDFIATLLTQPAFWLLLVLGLTAASIEIMGRYAYYRTDIWLDEIERHARWLQQYVRLLEHEPSDKKLLKRHASRESGVFGRRSREL